MSHVPDFQPEGMPRLPYLPYSVQELRERLQDLSLSLTLVDWIEAQHKRDAYVLHELQDIVMACEGRHRAPAHFIHAKVVDLVMGLYSPSKGLEDGVRP